MKIYIATPAFDGKVTVPYALSLLECCEDLSQNGISYEKFVTTSGSLLSAERNKLLYMFLQSDCTHILCVDADLGWQRNAVSKLLNLDLDFVAGCYPTRHGNQFIFRPAYNHDESLVVEKEKKVIKMEFVPAGFMLIKRSVIEKMVKDNPHLKIKENPIDEVPEYTALFNTEIDEEQFWGEDYVFCKRARKSDIEIWVDPELVFNHGGVVGSLSEIITNKSPEEQKKET